MPVLKITHADKGKLLVARRGDTILLELEENPATGFCWEVRKNNLRVLKIQGSVLAETSEPENGTMAMRKMTFLARETGISRLQLKYTRAWEIASAVADRLHFTVRVK